MPETATNLPEFSVTELSAALKRTLEDAFPLVRVRGEISGLKFHSSGHVYFDLKDEKAVLNAVIWKGVARALKVRPEAGLEVICTGRISSYAGSSRYQLIVEAVELAGAGALMAMLEERKKRLAAEGLFDPARKRPLPFLPDTIGVITSPTGAVIRDILHRLTDRFPRRVLLWPVAVQGDKCASEVAAAIEGFSNATGDLRPDVVIVARGGGSLEDLMGFNEECVVRAAAASTIALISAVGHETDVTLIDFAADVRAPTPTAAAEMAVPVRAELMATTLDLERRLLSAVNRTLTERRESLRQTARLLPTADRLFAQPQQRLDVASDHLMSALRANLDAHRHRFTATAARLGPVALTGRLDMARERLSGFDQRLSRALSLRLAEEKKRLEGLSRLLESVSFRGVLARGFALVAGEGGLHRTAAGIRSGEALTLTFADGAMAAVAGGPNPASVPGGGEPKARPHKPKSKPAANQGDLF